MQQGYEPASLFSGTSPRRRRAVIPLLDNGSARIELLIVASIWIWLPLNPTRPPSFVLSTRRSIRLLRFCLACTIVVSICSSYSLRTTRPPARLSGNRFEAYSSSSAYLDYVGRDFMTEGDGCQEEIKFFNPNSLRLHVPLLIREIPYCPWSDLPIPYFQQFIREDISWDMYR